MVNDRNESLENDRVNRHNAENKSVVANVITSSYGIISMMVVILIAILIFFTSIFHSSFSDTQIKNESLRLAFVLFRHGDRTPTKIYPNDPYQINYWPDGLGALTKRGIQQMFHVGGRLRNEYSGFLSEIYRSEDIYMESSNADRCIMSAMALLAGLYPPKGDQVWNSSIPWQPIPVHTIPRENDMILAMKKKCSKYDVELAEAYSSTYIQNINEQNIDLYKYLSNNAGGDFKTITDVEHLYTTLEIEELYGLKLPEWTKGIYPEKLENLTKKSLSIFSTSSFMRRIRGGSLLKEIIEKSTLKRKGGLKPNRKIFLYSGHDLTIIHLMKSLGFEQLMKPSYGATFIVELHEDSVILNQSTDWFVSLKYGEMSNFTRLEIPGCPEPCTLDSFIQLKSDMVPSDWNTECNS